MGIECNANFNLPYFSYSIKDFWRRWHISLSSWLRDYIYIPLGGNRGQSWLKNIRILITFFISGLWHGTGLQFIAWGLWHGILNLIPCKKAKHQWSTALQILCTFILVMFGWILFKAPSLGAGGQFISLMFTNLSISINTIIASVLPFTGDYSCLAYLLTVCLFIFVLFVLEWREWLGKASSNWKYIFYTAGIILFGLIGQNSFLYANF